MGNKKLYKTLLDELKTEISDAERIGEDMENPSWGTEEGILLSGNNAILIRDLLEKVLNIEKDDRIINQTSLLNWTRQWTDLQKKGKEWDFIRILRKFMAEYLIKDRYLIDD